ncbi:MAG: acyl-CoA dehydrogenase family protein [Acidimicrobiales bacterium]
MSSNGANATQVPLGGGAARRLLGAAPERLYAADLLAAIALQAGEADRTRSVAPEVIAAIKRSDLLALAASAEIGGLGESVVQIAAELEAVASACASTAWCLWNHLSVFHLFCGALGVEHAALLRSVVEAHQWVCFPGGAGTRCLGRTEGDEIVIDGTATFGSGGRYADWVGVAFRMQDDPDGPLDLRFTIVPLGAPGVRIEPTWDGMSVRASATDDLFYDAVRVPAARCVPWFGVNRAGVLRDPALEPIHPRYRQDWVGLSDLWLAAQAVGVVQAALDDACEGIRGRRAILGAVMAERPMVQVNLGQAASLLAGARAAVRAGCADADARIASGELPDELDPLRQMAHATAAIQQCDQAMRLILRVLGGNGLREGSSFERRYRDLQAMPVHINAHQDRVTEQLGKALLGRPLDAF